jgi:hypothetical protein
MGYISRDDLKDIEKNIILNSKSDTNYIKTTFYIIIVIILIFLYTAICVIVQNS